MSLVLSYHAAHKARLARMGGIPPRYQAPISPKPPVQPQAFDAGWDGMWFFDLVTCEYRGSKADIRIRDVQCAVAEYFQLDDVELLSNRRNIRVVRPRQIGYYLCKKLTTKSLPEIGRKFGRDHTSIIAGVRKIDELLVTDAKIAADVRAIAFRLRGGVGYYLDDKAREVLMEACG